jgi:hypothetical protein
VHNRSNLHAVADDMGVIDGKKHTR